LRKRLPRIVVKLEVSLPIWAWAWLLRDGLRSGLMSPAVALAHGALAAAALSCLYTAPPRAYIASLTVLDRLLSKLRSRAGEAKGAAPGGGLRRTCLGLVGLALFLAVTIWYAVSIAPMIDWGFAYVGLALWTLGFAGALPVTALCEFLLGPQGGRSDGRSAELVVRDRMLTAAAALGFLAVFVPLLAFCGTNRSCLRLRGRLGDLSALLRLADIHEKEGDRPGSNFFLVQAAREGHRPADARLAERAEANDEDALLWLSGSRPGGYFHPRATEYVCRPGGYAHRRAVDYRCRLAKLAPRQYALSGALFCLFERRHKSAGKQCLLFAAPHDEAVYALLHLLASDGAVGASREEVARWRRRGNAAGRAALEELGEKLLQSDDRRARAYGRQLKQRPAELERGVTALHSAVARGDALAISREIEFGADIEARDTEGATPLCWAARKGDGSTARDLITEGADRNAQDHRGRTPLHHAAQRGHLDVVETLLTWGVDVNVKDAEGNTPLDLAANDEIKRLIEERRSRK